MKDKTCVKCGSDKCIGFVLFHPKELDRLDEVKQRELKENPSAKFKLIRSTNKDGSPDHLFTKFMELHVIVEDNIMVEDVGDTIDKSIKNSITDGDSTNKDGSPTKQNVIVIGDCHAGVSHIEKAFKIHDLIEAIEKISTNTLASTKEIGDAVRKIKLGDPTVFQFESEKDYMRGYIHKLKPHTFEEPSISLSSMCGMDDFAKANPNLGCAGINISEVVTALSNISIDHSETGRMSSKKLKKMWNEAKKRNRPYHEIMELQKAYEEAKKDER